MRSHKSLTRIIHAFTFAATLAACSNASAIVNGDVVSEDTSWMVLVHDRNSIVAADDSTCSGVLVAPQWVLTTSRCAQGAGHSVNPGTGLAVFHSRSDRYSHFSDDSFTLNTAKPRQTNPRAVTLDIRNRANETGITLDVVDVIFSPQFGMTIDIDHPKFDGSDSTFGAKYTDRYIDSPALMKLSRAVSLTPLAIKSRRENVTMPARFYGWGGNGFESVSTELQSGTFTELERIGSRAYYFKPTITGTRACRGDNGGPVIANDQTGAPILLGLSLSTYDHCGEDDYIFDEPEYVAPVTRLTLGLDDHVDWIQQVVTDSEPDPSTVVNAQIRTPEITCYGAVCSVWLADTFNDICYAINESGRCFDEEIRDVLEVRDLNGPDSRSTLFADEWGMTLTDANFRVRLYGTYELTRRILAGRNSDGVPRYITKVHTIRVTPDRIEAVDRHSKLTPGFSIACDGMTCRFDDRFVRRSLDAKWVIGGRTVSPTKRMEYEFETPGRHRVDYIARDWSNKVRTYTRYVTVHPEATVSTVREVLSGSMGPGERMIAGDPRGFKIDSRDRMVVRLNTTNARLVIQKRNYAPKTEPQWIKDPDVVERTLRNGATLYSLAEADWRERRIIVRTRKDRGADWKIVKTYFRNP